MLGLACYASDDSDSEQSAPPPPKKVAPSVPKVSSIPESVDIVEEEPRLNIPSASTIPTRKILDEEENELESFTVKKRDWEVKEIEKQKKKLAKGKKKISAFGGLSSAALEPGDEEDPVKKLLPKPNFAAVTNSSSRLLSSLPPPKSVLPNSNKKTITTASFMPTSVRAKADAAAKAVPKAVVPKPKPQENEEEVAPEPSAAGFDDFLGLGSMEKQKLFDVNSMPKRDHVANPELFMYEESVGPARPQIQVEADMEELPSTSSNINRISDEEARKLIYKHELEAWGASNVLASNAVSGIIDISVDQILGPNVKETVLRNIDHTGVSSFASTRVEKAVGPKTGSQKLAKSKHQITHLAGLAVANEAKLQTQWAQNRDAKVASKRKYGF